MVSEIQADDEEMMDQLLRQGFLPLNTPVEKIGECSPCPAQNSGVSELGVGDKANQGCKSPGGSHVYPSICEAQII
jgi:hypothetical protein